MSYANISPWNASADVGQTFANLMLGMAQLKRQERMNEDANAWRQAQLDLESKKAMVHDALQKAIFERQTPLIEAQTANQNAGAGFDLARTAGEKQQQSAAQDAGLAALFQGLTPGGVPINPTTGGTFPATPENIKMLNDALLKRSLMESAALDSTGAANVLRPIEANKDTSIIDAITGKVIGAGPTSPAPGFDLSPGQRRYDATGKMIVENDNPRFAAGGGDNINAIVSALRSALQSVNTLGVDTSGLGQPPYATNPGMGQTFTNSMEIANLLQQELKNRFGGTNAPKAMGTNDVVRVATKEERDKLPPGTRYMGPDGQIAIKQ